MTLVIPRPKRAEAQWAFGYREPTTKQEQGKKDQNPLRVKERIYQYAKARADFEHIPEPDRDSRFRWYGIYTQRPPEDGFYMMRIRIPGGRLSTEQARAIAQISIDHGRDVADVTDRQNIQLHWIRIENIPEIWDRLEAVGLTTIEACGDTPRNILGCPLAGVDADEVIDATPYIYALNEAITADEEFSNLPRKYKMSITGCRHQCAVHEANDVGLVGVELDDGTVGFDVWVGGGLSSTPHFGQRLGAFVSPERAVEVCVGITSVFRDYGYRRSRNRARLKFLVADWGAAKFREVLEELYLGYKLPDGPAAKPTTSAQRDHTGVGRQRDSRNSVGFPLRSGRVSGTELIAIADIADDVSGGAGRVATTTQQKMVVLDVPDDRLADTMEKLDGLGFPVFPSAFRAGTMACTGIEFCKLSITETKARANWVTDELERRLPGFDEPLRINLNGCPNSCARYQLADIGFMGVLVTEKSDGNGGVERLEGYNVHLGGHLGDAFAFGRKARGVRLRADELPSFVERMVRLYLERRNGHTSFGQWINALPEKEIHVLAQTAAKGLERVGPPPVADVEDIRPYE